MRRETSIDPDWFEQLYRDEGDPWKFETSPYEAAKYDETLAALPAERCGNVLEIGCANGVLTTRLGPRCDRLLAVDVSETVLAAARARCADQRNIMFERRVLPAEAPAGPFDLILLSEVAYYWDRDDLARFAAWLPGALASGGHILLVHWTGETDYPLTGDEAVGELRALLGDQVGVISGVRHERYRLDLWRRA